MSCELQLGPAAVRRVQERAHSQALRAVARRPHNPVHVIGLEDGALKVYCYETWSASRRWSRHHVRFGTAQEHSCDSIPRLSIPRASLNHPASPQ